MSSAMPRCEQNDVRCYFGGILSYMLDKMSCVSPCMQGETALQVGRWGEISASLRNIWRFWLRANSLPGEAFLTYARAQIVGGLQPWVALDGTLLVNALYHYFA